VIEAQGLSEKKIGDQSRAFGEALQKISNNADLFSNDPYCKLTLARSSTTTTPTKPKTVRTSGKRNTLNPKWNEVFYL